MGTNINIKYMLSDKKNKWIIGAVAAVVSLIAVFVVYSALNRPGVALAPSFVSFDEQEAPVVEIPADAEVVYSYNDTSYNVHLDVYDTAEGYILDVSRIDPAKTARLNNLYSRGNMSSYRSNVVAVKVREGITSLDEYSFKGSNFPNLKVVDFSECPELETISSRAFYNNDIIEYINFAQDSAITQIPERVFYDCGLLKSIPFSKLTNLTTISCSSSSSSPFYCPSIEYIDLSKNTKLTKISAYTFYYMSSLKAVAFPEDGELTVDSYAFYNCSKLESVKINGLKQLGTTNNNNSVFSGCPNIAEVDFTGSKNLVAITGSSFQGTKITSLDMSDCVNLEKIGYQAFRNCKELTTVKFPENASIDTGKYGSGGGTLSYAFAGCAKLTTVEGCKSLSSVGGYLFYGCSALENIDFSGNENLTSIGPYAFYNCAISKVDFSDCPKLEFVGDHAFLYCKNVTSVDFSNCVSLTDIVASTSSGSSYGQYHWLGYKSGSSGYNTKVETADFSGCTSLKKIPNDLFYHFSNLKSVDFTGCTAVEEIGNYAFYDCEKLEEIDISSMTKLKSIGNYAFAYDKAMPEVDFKGFTELTNIGQYAFYQNSSVKTVDFSDCTTLESIGSYAFSYCDNLETVDFSNCTSIKSIGNSAFYNSSNKERKLKQVDFSGCTSLETIGGSMLSGQTNIEKADFSGCISLTKIPEYMFSNLKKLQTVDFSGCTGLTSIDRYAFNQCNKLSELRLDRLDSLETIGENAFYCCYNIKSFPFEQCPKLNKIGTNAFYRCVRLESVDFSKCPLLTEIPNYCFKQTPSLKSVKVGKNSPITTIGTEAFNGAGFSEFPFEDLTNLTAVRGTTCDISYSPQNGNGSTDTVDGISARYSCGAFSATYLTSVDLSKTQLTTIPGYMFSCCDKLENVTVGGKITSIGDVAFHSCKVLSDIDVESFADVTSIGNWAFHNTPLLTDFNFTYMPKLEKIGGFAFACGGLTEADLSGCHDVSQIGRSAFYDLQSLQKVVFPENCKIKTLSDSLFYNCKKLTSVNFDALTNLEVIQGRTGSTYSPSGFATCRNNSNYHARYGIISNSGLVGTSLDLTNSKNLREIQSGAYLGQFRSVDLSGLDKLATLGTSYVFGDGSIERVSFKGCSSLKTIPNQTFSGKSRLKKVDLTGCDAMTSLGEQAFYNCTSLNGVYLPKNLETIGKSAYSGCTAVRTINYDSKNLQTVGDNAFKNFGVNKSVTVNVTNNVDTVCPSIFASGMVISKVNFEGVNDSLYLGKDAFKVVGRPLSTMSDGETEYWVDADGVVYSKDKTKLYYVPSGIEEFTVPATVTQIMSDSCALATDLKSIVFEDISKIEKLSTRAFANCEKLARVTANGTTATTVTGAKALFAEGTAIGRDPFKNTALLDDEVEEGLTSGPLFVQTEIEEDDGNGGTKTSPEYSLSLVVNGASNLGHLNAQCVPARVPSVDAAALNENIYYYMTQESANLAFALSAPGAKEEKWCRLYFSASNDKVKFQGFELNETKQISAEGDVSVTFDVTLRKIPDTDIFYFEFPAKPSATLSGNLSVYMENLEQQNTSIKTWIQLCDNSSSEFILNPENFQMLYWYTAAHKNTLGYGTSQTTSNLKWVKNEDGTGQPRIANDLQFTVTHGISSSKVDGFAIDPVRSLAYEQWFKLPTGLVWEDWVVEAVKKGEWYSSSGSIYVRCADGTNKSIFTGPSNFVNMTASWDEKKGIVFSWDRNNSNLGTAAGGSESQEIGSLSASVYVNADEVFKFVGGADGYDFSTSQQIESYVKQTVDYVYANEGDTAEHTADMFVQEKSIKNQINTAKPIFTIDKTQTALTGLIDRRGSVRRWDLKIKNTGIVDGTYNRVTDSLPSVFTIRAYQIEQMFKERGDSLTITLNYPYVDTVTVPHTVTDMDGNEVTIDRWNSGSNMTRYMSSLNQSHHTRFVYTQNEDGNIVVKISEAVSPYTELAEYVIGEGKDYESVEAFYDDICFVDGYDTTYSVVWNEKNTGNNKLEPGEEKIYSIYCEAKRSFEKMTSNKRWSYGSDYSNNYGYLYYDNYETGKETSAYDYYYFYAYNEFAIYKDYAISGKNDSTGFSLNDIVDFSIKIDRAKQKPYDVLPIHDVLADSSQALLVPVAENAEAKFTDNSGKSFKLTEVGLRKVTVDGVQYYELSKPGEYTNIWVGNYAESFTSTTSASSAPTGDLVRAEKVTVSQGIYTLTTNIWWYMANAAEELPDEKNRYSFDYAYIKYKTIVREDLGTMMADENDLVFGSNSAFINGKGSHMLYDVVGGTYNTVSVVPGSVIGFDKKIVTENAMLPDEKLETKSEIKKGELVTYKLTLTNSSEFYDKTVTNVYDMLPNTYGAFDWSKDNVSIQMITSNPNGNASAEKWGISQSDPSGNGTDRFFIYWNEDGEPTKTEIKLKPKETIYFYVSLQFPTDQTVWGGFEKSAFDDNNKLFNDYFVNGHKAEVSHNLKASGEAKLQKGVYGIFKDNKLTGDRNVFESRSRVSDRVTYYTVLYNSGNSRLYISDITDVLPKGFYYYNMVAVSEHDNSISSGTGYNNNYYSKAGGTFYDNPSYKDVIRTLPYKEGGKYDRKNLLATVVDGKNNLEVEYVQAYVKAQTVSKTDVNGDLQQTLKFTVTRGHPSHPDGDSSYPLGNISYDEDEDMCYLEKGQALVFGYAAVPGMDNITPDVATNKIAMQYYDYNDAGQLAISPEEVKIGGFYQNYAESTNDGSAYKMDDFEASTGGIVGEWHSDWLASNVDVSKGDVVPGAIKKLTGKIDEKGEYTDASNGALLSDSDIAEWALEMTSDGTNSIYGYSITDEVDAPFYFTGDLKFYIETASGYKYSSTHKGSGRYASSGSSYISDHVLLNDIKMTKADGTKIDAPIEEIGKENIIVTFNTSKSQNRGNYVSHTLHLGEELTFDACWYGGYQSGYDFATGGSYYVPDFRKFSVVFDLSAKGNFTVKVTPLEMDRSRCIPTGGKAVMVVDTMKPSNSVTYSSYFNSMSCTCDQYFNPESVSSGALIRDSEDNVISIDSASMITLAGAYATVSYKEIRDDSREDNYAVSTDTSKNYIALDWDDSKNPPYSSFSYTLNVENKCPAPLFKMVVIDNLPEVGDTLTYSGGINPRGSQFKVILKDITSFEVADNHEDGSVNKLDRLDSPAGLETSQTLCYTVEFSEKNEYTDDDWSGKATEQWISYAEALERIKTDPSYIDKIRSFRVITGGDNENGLSNNGTLSIKCHAVIQGDDAVPNEISWNNFGYKYYVRIGSGVAANVIPLSASAMNVGVKTATIPKIKKELVSPSGVDIDAEELGIGAKFLVYETEPGKDQIISFENEQELLKKLYDGNYKFTTVELTSAEINDTNTTGLVKGLAETYICQASETDGKYGYTKTDQRFYWVSDLNYTFVEIEIPDQVLFSKMNNNSKNSQTITYKPSSSYTISCVNLYDDYNLTLRKTDADSKAVVPGAKFARYGAVTGKFGDAAYKAQLAGLWAENVDAYIEAAGEVSAAREADKVAALDVTGVDRLTSAKASGYDEFIKVTGVVTEVSDLTDTGDYFSMFYTVDNNDGTITTYYFKDTAVTDEKGFIQYHGLIDDKTAFREVIAPVGYKLNFALTAADRTVSCGETQYVDVSDVRMTELPKTGGEGTLYIVLFGICLILSANAAVTVRAIRRRKCLSDSQAE